MCDHHHHHHHDSETSLSFFFTYATTGWTSAEGRTLVIYSVILFTSSIFEVIFGFNTSDSHVVSEGFHTIFHALCIWSAMIALAYSSKHKKADSFCPFGYSRAQVIAAFGNSMYFLLVFTPFLKPSMKYYQEKPQTPIRNFLKSSQAS
jgi:Co/Zn/Cd efflux system component